MPPRPLIILCDSPHCEVRLFPRLHHLSGPQVEADQLPHQKGTAGDVRPVAAKESQPVLLT